jgi:hypothetical protein
MEEELKRKEAEEEAAKKRAALEAERVICFCCSVWKGAHT